MLTPRIKPLRVFFGTRDLDSKKYFSGKKKVHFRILDLGESDHADSNEPPFQRPIFFKLTLPNTRGRKKTPKSRKTSELCPHFLTSPIAF